MSYCRWSSDGWKSDVYVYESAEDFTIHVATNKRVHADPCPKVDWKSGGYLKQCEEEQRWVDESTLEPLGLPHDGETYREDSAEECVARLLKLREAGYHVPQYAIDNLKEEIEE
ncbi:MAG: hypothetical protein ACXABY_14080 [Candidatus Thorarchaeota archaeon]|jgi:hypothetical protein